MNKRQAKKQFKKIFGEKIWRMMLPIPAEWDGRKHRELKQKRRKEECQRF